MTTGHTGKVTGDELIEKVIAAVDDVFAFPGEEGPFGCTPLGAEQILSRLAPLIESSLREQIAGEIDTFRESIEGRAVSTRRDAYMEAARIARGRQP